MSDLNDNISFEYDDEDDDENEIDQYESSFVFESDENEQDDSYESKPTSNIGQNLSEKPSNKHLEDDSLVTGCNGTLYLPWSAEQYIKLKFIDALTKLRNFHLYSCTDDELLIMLQYKKWEQDEVLNSFFDDHDEFFKKCGIPLKNKNNTFETVKDFSCFICCDDYESTEVYSLTCNHQYCIKCYHHYVSNEVANGHLITCIEPNCKLTIPHKDISHMFSIIEAKECLIIVEKSLLQNPLLIANARELINTKSNFKWCPAIDCNSFTELALSDSSCQEQQKLDSLHSNDITKVPIVGCYENHEFCFNCGYENHLPCPCWIVKMWVKKCEDDSETASWIDANTHACPKCHTSIEKNGGCNHMTCRKCKFEFCWICLNNWNEHNNNYSCNRYRDGHKEDEIRRNKSRQALERYLHFFKRYSIHETSMKGDQKTLRKIDDVTKIYMEDRRSKNETNLSWIDIEFLPEAMRSLQNGRKTLKWTYCFAFYLARSNFSQIFETNQDFLNKSVEDLSEVFEKIMDKKNEDKVGTILKNKLKIINLSELITTRQRNLIKSAGENLISGLLEFEID